MCGAVPNSTHVPRLEVILLALFLGAAGWLAFVLGALLFGLSLRRRPSADRAERYSRVMHLLFFLGLGAPFLVAAVSPGLTHLDALVGLPPLPLPVLRWAIGGLLALPGLFLLGASNRLLRSRGDGANAFRLTRRVVATDIYGRTRNPMSLGYYLACVSLALLLGSSLLLGYVLVGVIPAHLLFLRFFEERELALRLGESYTAYQRAVPFLLPAFRAGERSSSTRAPVA